MVKKATLILTCLSLLFSLTILMKKSFEKSLTQTIEDKDNKQRFEAIGVEVFDYRQSELVLFLHATRLRFVVPNLLLAEEGFQGWQKRPDGTFARAKARQVAALLKDVSSRDLFGSAKLDYARLMQSVTLDLNQYNIATTEAVLTPEQISSDQPVDVRQKKQWIKSDSGFVMHLSSSLLKLLGRVQGVFFRD